MDVMNDQQHGCSSETSGTELTWGLKEIYSCWPYGKIDEKRV